MEFPPALLQKGKLGSEQLVLLQYNVQRLYLHVLVMREHCETQRVTGVSQQHRIMNCGVVALRKNGVQ
jgi:hypothetical protein